MKSSVGHDGLGHHPALTPARFVDPCVAPVDPRPTIPTVKLWNPFGLRELNALWKDPVFRGRGVPRGDGRSVLLVPGFLSGDWSMRLLHGWLGRIGDESYPSGIHLN